ncbi:MAG: type II toxin-antitoxin system RelE/ParE family toxin [Actinomycetota bacterium]
MSAPALSPRATKDLERIARADRRAARAVVRVLEALARVPPPANLDVKALEGRPPWRRLRTGDWRIAYRPLERGERTALSRTRGEPVEAGTVLVERIVNRRDLERILAALP